MTALFSDPAQLNISDYQVQIEPSYTLCDEIDNNSSFNPCIKRIRSDMEDNDFLLRTEFQ